MENHPFYIGRSTILGHFPPFFHSYVRLPENISGSLPFVPPVVKGSEPHGRDDVRLDVAGRRLCFTGLIPVAGWTQKGKLQTDVGIRVTIPMTDPWCWYINANIKGVY